HVLRFVLFLCKDCAPLAIYPLSLHDALPIYFRLGLVRDIPGFGGADIRQSQPLSFPRLFYGIPTIAPALFGICLSQTETEERWRDRKSTRLNSSHLGISYAVFCLKKKKPHHI